MKKTYGTFFHRKSNSETNGENRSTLRRNQEINQMNQRDVPMNKYQKIDNPPLELPPPPPTAINNGQEAIRHESATTNFSKTVKKFKLIFRNLNLIGKFLKVPSGRTGRIYSSNDSGFDNEVPPAPEVDYSDDDDLPKKMPIRFVESLGLVESC